MPRPILSRTGVPAGVWVSALFIRLPITWRSRGSSPSTMKAVPGATTRSTGRPGDDPRVLHRVGGQREQVHRGLGERPLLVDPGQREQVLDEQAHPRRFRLDPAHEVVEFLG